MSCDTPAEVERNTVQCINQADIDTIVNNLSDETKDSLIIIML